MGLFDYFKRPTRIRDAATLTDFLDRKAAFLTQKGVYEYSRARAGHYSKVLFAEPGFQAAVEESRWRVYPLSLLMVTEMADGVLFADGGSERKHGLPRLTDAALAAFEKYDVPSGVGEDVWRELRADLVLGLQRIVLHPPKRAMDIPVPYAQKYFDLMPIHEKLRGRDFPTMQNYLAVTLCNMHQDLTDQAEVAEVRHALSRETAHAPA